MGTNEFGKMMKIIQILEEGRVTAKETKNWRIEGAKKRITRKEYQRLLNKFDMEGLMAQKRLVELGKGRKIMKERGELPNGEGDAVTKDKVMHEENFWSNWPREDERGKEERKARYEKNEGEKCGKRKREEEKEEYETATVKRKCESSVSVEAFEIFSQGTDMESCGNLSWEDLLEKHEDLFDYEPEPCAHVRVVPDVAGVPVAPSSVVTEWCEAFSCCPDWQNVLPQSFSFSKKRALLYKYATRDEV